MSNAHVVAGSETVTVEADGQTYDATVVSYDPDADISILDVPGLPAAPLPFAQEPAKTGTDALVLGYPGGGEFQATPARVRETIELKGPDIYKSKTVDREVYTIRGTVRQGNSGGPMIDRRGPGARRGVRRRGRRRGDRLRADRQGGRPAAGQGSATPQPVATGACVSLSDRPVRRWSRKRDQLVVDRVRRLFVGEMPCARRWIRSGRAARTAGCGSPASAST